MKQHFISISIFFLLTPLLLAADSPTQQPNIILIVSDDLTSTAIQSFGNKTCNTPNIDRLAAEGVTFNRTYCQYPVCGASRASFTSGLYPETTGFLGNIKLLGSYRALNPTFAEHPSIGGFLRQHGYVSARVSKIYHMGVPGGIEAGEPGGDEPDSWDRAYDVWGPETGSVGEFKNLSPAMKHWGGAFVRVIVPDDHSHTQTDELAINQAIAILENRSRHRNEKNFLKPGQPFFLAVGLVRPHVPLIAPARHFAAYPAKDMHLPVVPENDLQDVPVENRRKANKTMYKMTDAQQHEALAAYYASVSYMDEQVGRLLHALDALELADNTVVVFISDHGWLLGEHGCWQKSNLFEPTCQVPLIIRAPGYEKSAGATSFCLTELVDIYPTIVELAGLESKAPRLLEGYSLVPLLRDPSSSKWSRSAAYTVMGGKRNIHRSIRTERFRYSQYSDGSEELYDHELDPDEHTNRVGDPQLRENLDAMRGIMSDQKKRWSPARQ